MIGMVLVTHGRLAEALRAAMEHVVGVQKGVATICIDADDDVEQRRRDIRSCIEAVDTGDGVIIITDMFGGTPSNLAISMMDRPGVDVIAGANLPMLVKLAKMRSRQTLSETVDCALAAGHKYIASASSLLRSGTTPNLCMLDPRQNGGCAPHAEPLPLKAKA
ncbi:MAG TPA: PTS sugar transporter subunit IIA [Acetobacteraceae bacterium]|nr:PTS sugar transporter subunit IIA [Acetobacteraceae bacterium]